MTPLKPSHEDDPPTKPVNPPPLRRKRSPLPSAIPNRDAGRFTDSEAPTRPQGIEFDAALLVRYYREMAPEDRVCLLRNAEQSAARNRK